MNYFDLIKNWHEKMSNEDDFFSSYVFEYLAFICYLRTQLDSDTAQDRQAIQRLKRNKVLKKKPENNNEQPYQVVAY